MGEFIINLDIVDKLAALGVPVGSIQHGELRISAEELTAMNFPALEA
jgi:hypothetical protein